MSLSLEADPNWQAIAAAKTFLAARCGAPPEVAVVLGSGLGAFAERVREPVVVPYAEVPSFAVPHVEGHRGELVFGWVGEVRVAVLCGRVHYYEGHDWPAVTRAVRVMAALGAKKLIVTNAAGGLNPGFSPGELMVLNDHINLTGESPLRGRNDPGVGPRFCDMTEAYDRGGRRAWHAAARDVAGVHLKEGVYVGVSGPAYETPAEVRMMQRLGGDAVGMSTVAEVLVARHQGMQVAGLSVITNQAAGQSGAALSHDEVTETAGKVRGQLCDLLTRMVTTWR